MSFKYSIKKPDDQFISLICIYIFFAFYCGYFIYKIIQPELLYFKLQPFFSTDLAYLEFLHNYRLGAISFLTQFILQRLYYPVSGTIILTSILLFSALLIRISFNKLWYKALNGIEFIPVVLILSSLKNYTEITNTLVLYGISGIFLLINHFLHSHKTLYRLGYNVLTLIISYYIFGSATSIMIFIGFLTYELLNTTSLKDKILISTINIFIKNDKIATIG